jgi:hypothetical protein
MTIAMCSVTPEGVVLGADSAMSVASPKGFHYLNFNQKLFEIGEGSTLGLVTWGLGGLSKSYRTLTALLADGFRDKPPNNVEEVAQRWTDLVWPMYTTDLQAFIQRLKLLMAQATRTPVEEEELKNLKRGLVVGFCIGGYLEPDREPKAYELIFDPLATAKPSTQEQKHIMKWWGAPNPIMRLINAIDQELKEEILKCGWSKTPADLDAVCQKHALRIPLLPIRDAVDLVHACISSTIKAMKFSDLPQICGGPIEIAVITTDRRFRWVRHKPWDAAILEGVDSL